MATTIEIERMSVKELRDLLHKIDALIIEKQQADRATLREALKALAAESGLSIEEVFGGSSKRRKTGSVAAKYRNPDNSNETWSGRGRSPLWLVEKLSKRGAKKEDFAI